VQAFSPAFATGVDGNFSLFLFWLWLMGRERERESINWDNGYYGPCLSERSLVGFLQELWRIIRQMPLLPSQQQHMWYALGFLPDSHIIATFG
jgi:hypothetical protein